MLEALWQYFHKLDGNVCLQWTVPHPARPNNQFVQVRVEQWKREERSGSAKVNGVDRSDGNLEVKHLQMKCREGMEEGLRGGGEGVGWGGGNEEGHYD